LTVHFDKTAEIARRRLLCTDGAGEIAAGGESAPIRRGDSFLVPHATGDFRLAGDVTVFRAFVARP